MERFHSGLNQLAAKPGLFRVIAWQFRKYYVDATTVKRVLLKLFGASSSDVDALEGKYTKSSVYQMFADHYKNSINGIAEDFSFVMTNWQTSFADLRADTVYMHGLNDPVTSLDEFKEFALQNPNAKIETFEDAGHFMALSHSDQVWGNILNILEDR